MVQHALRGAENEKQQRRDQDRGGDGEKKEADGAPRPRLVEAGVERNHLREARVAVGRADLALNERANIVVIVTHCSFTGTKRAS